MRKIAIAALLLAVLPWSAGAQVEKQVEVTKAYVPSVESASKLAIIPDMTDTTMMRPEIDYTITPLSLQTSLVTRPIRPAKVTYWEFNRPLPFYLKVGAGYPLNSVLDFYASTQNPGTGYAVGYVNHEGRYSKISNLFGVKNNSTRMTNRIGAAAGKYFGKRTLEGDISYENRLYHRYSTFLTEGASVGATAPGARVDYGDANVAVRFGDDFQDLSRVNFEIALRGGMFFDHSDTCGNNNPARQTSFGASAKIARGFGRHRISAEVGYERLAGHKSIADYREQFIRAGLRYGYQGGAVRFEAGADYVYDRNDSLRRRSYLLPFLRLDAELGTPGLKPFLEIDGDVRENSYRLLTMQNPYVLNPTFPSLYSSVNYNGRLGIGGSLWRNRLTYRVYAAFSIHDNNLYWVSYGLQFPIGLHEEQLLIYQGSFVPKQARQTVTSFNGEIEWRPVSPLLVSLGLHAYAYNDETTLKNGSPAFRGNLGLRYEGRKFSFGVMARMQSARKWTTFLWDEALKMSEDSFTAPFALDLQADVVWKVSGKVSLFAEGRNLANRQLYEFPWYPEYGANFTLGMKANF